MIAPEARLRAAVKAKGGFVNAHAHYDRANSLPDSSLESGAQPLKSKWSYIDGVKRASTVEDYEARIRQAVAEVRATGTTASMTFVDADDVAGDRALIAAAKVRDELGDEFPLRLANHGYAGVLTEAGRQWFDRAAEIVDIIGGMPEKDAPHNDKHLDVLLSIAKRRNRLVHAHVDQLGSASETETELLAIKTIEHGMEGKVWAVHSVSLAAHPEAYRKQVYKLLKDAGVGIIICPTAYLDERRSEELMPHHNPIAPIEELIAEGIPVALGTDNISDTYKPLATGDMWLELRFAIELGRMYDVNESTLVDLATTNARRAIGI
ncbi:MAG: amidohydrolase family protein [Patescibacteria group bacterium]